MLKNRKAIYALIPLNLCIWGYFAYRIFSAFGDTVLVEKSTNLQAIKMDVLKDSVTYELQLDYKDPFLKDVSRTFHSNNKAPKGNESNGIILKKAAVTIPPKILPEVKYLGLIKNKTSGITTALVSINGQLRYVKPNNTEDGILFKSFTRDSLVAKWGKERIVARK